MLVCALPNVPTDDNHGYTIAGGATCAALLDVTALDKCVAL
jgi:hypothetical protein